MRNKDVVRRWVYNEHTGTLSRKVLTYYQNEMEAWYQDSSCSTYDPFHIDEDRARLMDRVHASLSHELQEVLHDAEKLMATIRKLHNHGIGHNKVSKK